MKMLKRWIAFCLVILLLAGVVFNNSFMLSSEVEAADLKESEAVEAEAVDAEASTLSETGGDTGLAEESMEAPVEESQATKEVPEIEPQMTEKAPEEEPQVTEEVPEEATKEAETSKHEMVAEPETNVEQAQKTEVADKKEEAQDKPVSLNFENDDVTITVSEAKAGAIPEGATIKVVPILADDKETAEQYKEVEEQIQKKAEEDEKEIQGFLAYDITFVDNVGNEIEPNSDVKVTLDYKEPAIPAEKTVEEVKDAEVSVLHLEEDTNGNIKEVVDMGVANKIGVLELGTEQQVKKVELTTNSFSAYTLVWTSSEEKKVNLEITCIDSETEEELNVENKTIELNTTNTVFASEIAPSIAGYIYNRAEIKLKNDVLNGRSVEFDRLRWQEGYDDKLQAYYNDGSSTGFKKTGYYFKTGSDLDKVEITFYYTDASQGTGIKQFYYVYVTPDDDGMGYKSELIWSGDRLATAEDISGLRQNEKDMLKNRFGFEDGDDTEDLSYNQTLTVEEKTWENIEYVGSRVYNSSELDTTDFKNIHYCKNVLENLKRVGSTYQYKAKVSEATYQDLEDDESIVILFADRLDYTRAEKGKYQTAFNEGKITDYSEHLNGNGDVTVDITKSAEWVDYFDRLAEITFKVNGTPKIDPLDIVLVIDTSYSMDFSNYDWDYNECSPDISERTYEGYNRYDRFFEDQSAPNKLTGTSRMEDTLNAAFSFIKTFMTNNSESSSANNNRVAVIGFNDGATQYTGFTENFDQAIGAVESISTESGTNTGEAIGLANSLVESRNDKSRKCVTIVLSDGAPNRVYTNFADDLEELTRNSTVYSIGVDLSDEDEDKIKEGFPGEGKTPQAFLATIKSENGEAYNVVSGQNMVSDCFEDIINDLTTAATEAKIYDIVGEFFSYQASTDGAESKDEDKVEIPIGDISIVDNTVSFTAKLYDNKKNFVGGYKTNQNDSTNDKDVYLGYKVDETEGSKPVTEDPELNVYREVQVRYYYLNANGEKQPINIDGTSTHDVTNYIDDGINDLKGIDEYESYERLTGDTSTFTVTQDILDKYINSYSGVYVESDFLTESTENTYTLLNDNTKNVIDVVYYNNDQEDPLYIEVQKTFSGLTDKAIQALKNNFYITVKDSDNNIVATLKLGENQSIPMSGVTVLNPVKSGEEPAITYTWRIINVGAGTYSIEENGTDTEGYHFKGMTVNGVANSTVTTQNPEFTATQKGVITSQNTTTYNFNDIEVIVISLTDTKTTEYVVWTVDSLSVGEREGIQKAIAQGSTGQFGNSFSKSAKIAFFSSRELIENGFDYRGKISVNENNELVFEGGKDQWNQIWLGTYEKTGAVNAEIEVVNNYEPETMDVDLKKFMTDFTTPLNGAKFSLYTGKMDSAQNKINWNTEPTMTDFVVSNDDGQIELTGLNSGYYKLVETEAPLGYLKLTQPIIFKLDTVNKTIQFVDESGTALLNTTEMWRVTGNCIEIKNNIVYDLPSNGGSGIYWYLFSGMALMMAATLIVYKNKRGEVLKRK